jgi:hypothetical protein
MGARRLIMVGVALVLGGCGGSSAGRTPTVSGLPLVPGAKVVAVAKQCDGGANAYCALQLVMVDSRYDTSLDLLADERQKLLADGWTGSSGDTGNEHAADSPGHQLRVTYATVFGDLMGVDLGWIKRQPQIALALSGAIFDRTAGLSMLLETGPG